MNGAVTTALTIALFAGIALRPPRPRHSTPFTLSFAVSWWINELPFLGLWWLVSGTVESLLHPRPGLWWWLLAGLSALDALILAYILLRARSARAVLSAALQGAYGPEGYVRYSRGPWWRVVLLPFVAWRPDVRKVRNLRYGQARRGNLLDVYVSRRPRRGTEMPVLVYFHGGGLAGSGFGSKAIFAHALMYHLAARGWVCVSANYRMHSVRYRDQLADVRGALDWVRAHAREFGGDPDAFFVSGGSSGANLAATAALSGSAVSGVIGLYGFYGSVGASVSPHTCVTSHAPPFLIVHGKLDALVRYEDARAFAEHLRSVSRQPVAYAELPGANHNFDLFPSLRLSAVADAIARFAELTRGASPAPYTLSSDADGQNFRLTERE
jgi:acetyl esterase/lipase